MIVTLGGQEGEGLVSVPADALGRFFDLVDVVEAEESEGEVAEDGHGVGSVLGPGLVVVFSPGGVSYVVGFVGSSRLAGSCSQAVTGCVVVVVAVCSHSGRV